MNKPAKPRAPAAFRLDDTAPTAASIAIEEASDNLPAEVMAPTSRRRRRSPWVKLFVAATGALISLAIGIWAVDAVFALFARQDWLGWTALGLAALAALGALGWVYREIFGLMRLARVGHIRELAAHAGQSDTAAARLTVQMTALFAHRADLAAPIRELGRQKVEIIDPPGRVALAERLLLAPLDAEAKRLVASTAKRVSVVTAISPAALVDLGFVAFAHLRLIRRLAELYGGKPGLLASTRLARLVVTHLVVTGGIAIGDGLLQQVLGHGLAARLSARLGEGVLNGILATRVGLAAIEVCRPMPFAALPKPTVTELAATVTKGMRGKEKTSSEDAG